MQYSRMSAEDIGFLLRQIKSGVPSEALEGPCSIGSETLQAWTRLYSELFHSEALTTDAEDTISAYFKYLKDDLVIETELRDCKIRYTHIQNVPSTVTSLINAGKKIGFYHGPVRFNVSDFGGPTLHLENASVKIQHLLQSAYGKRELMTWVEVEVDNHPHRDKETSAGFLVLSAEQLSNVQTPAAKQQCPLLAVVNRLYCGRLTDIEELSDRVVVWDRPLMIGIEAIARNPVDAVRTFYTSDLDTILIGNSLLDKDLSK